MMQAAAKHWQNVEQEGSIVNVVAAFQRGMPQIAHTSAARSAVSNLAQSLAVEWAPHKIRVNCIAPGLILHEGLYQIPNLKKFVDRYINESPFKRAGTPLEVANAVLFLASEQSNYITGEIIYVSGGRF